MSGFVAGIKSLTGINQELATLNRQLKDILSNLDKIKAAAGGAMGEVKKVTTSGGQKGNGKSGNSQMSGSLSEVNAGDMSQPSQNNMAGSMSKFSLYMKNGGTQVLGSLAQGVLGVAGAMFSAAPDMALVGARQGAYYTATAGLNMSQKSLERATFSALRGSLSSTGEDAAVAGILSGRGYMPGSKAYMTAAKEVAGLYNFMGMSNSTAAQAIGGIHSGRTAAKLYGYGINVTDPRTGAERSTSQIVKDLFQRIFPTGASAKDVARSFQYGNLGGNLRGFGFDEAQQQIIYKSMLDMASGGSGNLATKAQGNALLGAAADIATSDTGLMIDKQDAMIKGFERGARNIEFFNEQMEKLPDSFYELNGQLSALAGSRSGQGVIGSLSAAFGALTGAVMGLVQMIGVGAALSATGKVTGAGSVLASGPMGAVKEGSKFAKYGKFVKGGGVLGSIGFGLSSFSAGREGAEKGEGWDWGNFITGTLGGAATGFMFGGLAGAAAGAAVAGGGYFAGQVSGGGIGGDGDLPGPTQTILPVGNARVSSEYGSPRTKDGKQSYHHGRDYAVPLGTPVKAARDGIVDFVGGSDGHVYGYHIIIDHQNGLETLYGHLKAGSFKVRKGQTVSAGTVIALSGNSGNSTGPHLHFEVRRSGKAISPVSFLSGASSSAASSQSMSNGESTTTPGASGSGFLTIGLTGLSASTSPLSSRFGSKSLQELMNISGSYVTVSGDAESSPATNSTGTSGSYGRANIGKTDLLKTLYDAGFKDPDKLATAYAVVMAESGGRASAEGDRHLVDKKWGLSVGLFQIRTLKDWKAYNDPYRDISRLYDPAYNAKAGFIKSNGGKNWGAWSAYTNGSYKEFLPSKEELNKSMAAAGIPASGGASGPIQPSFASMSRNSSSNITSVTHAGNTVNITVNVQQATEKEARYLATKVKEILENESSISAIGGQ